MQSLWRSILNNIISNPVICALDTKDIDEAKKLCVAIKPYVGMVKLGLEFFTMHGPQGIAAISAAGIPIFLDMKFHDIPNTVAEAVRSAIRMSVSIITVHTLGGEDMMKAAAMAAEDEAKRLKKPKPMIFGVTILTSMDKEDISDVGIGRSVAKQVEILAKLARKSGLEGVVCSPHEIAKVKTVCGSDFKTIVPGIRPKSSEVGDQKRVMTPGEAIKNGADYLVIGRPITKALKPVEAAKSIYLQLLN
jgi:orotidine-5'-phosphate decarboxylase